MSDDRPAQTPGEELMGEYDLLRLAALQHPSLPIRAMDELAALHAQRRRLMGDDPVPAQSLLEIDTYVEVEQITYVKVVHRRFHTNLSIWG